MHVDDERRRAAAALALDASAQGGGARRLWTLHYQPLIVDLDDGSMVGVEALIRWNDPNGGLVPPGRVHPARRGDGADRGDRRLGRRGDRAARTRRGEPRASRSRSGSTSRRAAVAARPRRADRCRGSTTGGMDPTKVIVEVTESTAMTDPDRTLADPVRAARPRAAAGDRRLRHRLLVALPAQAHAGRHPEDRPVVRPRRARRSRRPARWCRRSSARQRASA